MDLSKSDRLHGLKFNATGGEYFRIWIVNLLLTIVTLGIYSAWAKVRRNQYFYSSTQLAGSSFEYHGNAIAILKGRLLALAVIVAYNVASSFSQLAGIVMLCALGAVLPWLLWKSLQFKLFNTSYRGIRFGFGGNAGQAYLNYLLWPVLSALTLWLLTPAAHYRIKRFQHSESRFGAARFAFSATTGGFYKAYLLYGLIAVGGLAAIMTVAGAGGALFQATAVGPAPTPRLLLALVFSYVWLFGAWPLFMTMIQNLVWNHTQLGEHRFRSDMKWGRMSFIFITNLLGVIVTLGLFIPFAQVRALKYRLEATSVLAAGSLDEFVAGEQRQVSATGEGVADLLDFDLSM